MRSLPPAVALPVLLLVACAADPQAALPDSAAGSDDAGPDTDGATPARDDVVTRPFDTTPAPPDTADGGETSTDGAGDAANPDAEDATPDGQDTADVPPAEIPLRACEHVFTFTPAPDESVESVTVAGTFNDWDPDALPMEEGPGGTWTATLDLEGKEVGSQAYKLVVNGDDWRLDPANKMRRYVDGVVNSKLLVPDCHRPALVLEERTVDTAAGAATVEVAVRRGVGGELTPGSPRVRHDFEPVEGAWDPARSTLRVILDDLPEGKHTLRFDAAAPAGAAEPLVVSFWVEPEPFQWRDAVLYFAFTDRFRDGDPGGQPADCLDADAPSNWKGGDWVGLREAVEEGYFDDLGVNAIWINAPMDNPNDCDGGLFGRKYTAYHAYFPADLEAPEDHFGTMEDLRALVSAAHARGIRVLVDLVINHVHEDAPEWQEHQDDGWFNLDGVCRDQDWEHPETCWFEPYLPDLAHQRDVVVERITDVALQWAIEADLDGFRVDAVKHVHRHALHTLRAKLDRRIEAGSDVPFWTVGETFTGGWGGGTGSEENLIKAYIGPSQLYGQFDFPLFWAVLGAFAHETTPLSRLGEVMVGSAGFYGPDAIMASFLGNHDVARFVSVAAGDVPEQCPGGSGAVGWECPPAQPSDPEPYRRLERAFTFLAAAPEIPLIYYGDEIGLAGAGDPDNRRPMPWGDIPDRREQIRDRVGALMQARRDSRALRRGDVSVVSSYDDLLVFTRTDGDDRAVAAFNLGDAEQSVVVSADAGATLEEAVEGATLTAGADGFTIALPPRSARLWTTPAP
ncbi:MAG: alpha-amylase family glycosyl hydrolase [Myxococcota bacterium]